ncbi:hypothetical protein P8452_66464 [Trifolium repens]|nr:hypothetical protein P8452_66464 [Trifolium repens]
MDYVNGTENYWTTPYSVTPLLSHSFTSPSRTTASPFHSTSLLLLLCRRSSFTPPPPSLTAAASTPPSLSLKAATSHSFVSFTLRFLDSTRLILRKRTVRS